MDARRRKAQEHHSKTLKYIEFFRVHAQIKMVYPRDRHLFIPLCEQIALVQICSANILLRRTVLAADKGCEAPGPSAAQCLLPAGEGSTNRLYRFDQWS